MWLFWDIAIMQDYTEEFREITKGSKSKEALPAGSITLINQRPVGEDLHVKFCLHTLHTDAITRNLILTFVHTPIAKPLSTIIRLLSIPIDHVDEPVDRLDPARRSIAKSASRQLATDVSAGRVKMPPSREIIQDGFPFSASGS